MSSIPIDVNNIAACT